MVNYQSTPDYYRDYIEHSLLTELGYRIYDNYKINTDKNYAKKHKEKREQKKKYLREGAKKTYNYAKEGANKAHKYIYKYLNKKGKVIYVYDTQGKSHLRRMASK